MVTKDESKSITIDLDVVLIPLSILLSAIMVSASILYTFRDGTAKKTTTNTVTTDSSIESLVEEIDVDTDKFAECVVNNDFKDEIAKDTSDGQAAGVTGTPGFIVGTLGDNGQVEGVLISGAQPYAAFEAELDKQLGGNGDKSAKVGIDDDPILGDKDKAKVAIVEFSDFECPFCQRFHNDTFNELVENYVDNGKAIYVYRDFPLDFHEPKASEAASAANCVQKVAGDEKYFEFSKLYYERTKSNGDGL
jgi:protein-disulfide isomerase